ncbi:hypothetical protein A9Q99_23925 [Gammaproteobacteria bacterium 45_16_T64]|nr:hypothetical protein A9Q99_23925 [Gammaproteobacteria bacterium 45_16_T64]
MNTQADIANESSQEATLGNESLNQFAYVPGSNKYQFGYRSISNIPITGAPNDTCWERWAMLFDGNDYRLYFFKASTNDTLYQFAFNRDTNAYEYGFNSIATLKLTGIPSDACSSSFAMLHDGTTYRLYLRRLGYPAVLYQFGFNSASSNYEYGHNSIPTLEITGAPSNIDWSRWGMLHDKGSYRLYAMQLGNNNVINQAAYNVATGHYEFGYNSIPELALEGTPNDSNLGEFSMLFDGTDYRLYLQKI